MIFTLTFSREEVEELINGLNWAGNEGQDGELADPLKARLRSALDGPQWVQSTSILDDIKAGAERMKQTHRETPYLEIPAAAPPARPTNASPAKAPGDLNFYDDTLHVDLWYPNIEREPKDPPRTFDHPVAVQVGLMHVRAADDIRIEYDFERDGYVVKQGSIFEWPASDTVCDRDWQEVAFVEAWGRQVETDDAPETERNT